MSCGTPAVRIVRGDTPTLDFVLRDGRGKLLDLSGFTQIWFRMAKEGEDEPKIQKQCEITNAPGTDGKCYTVLTGDDTDEDGVYFAQVELKWDEGLSKHQSCERFIVQIVNEVPEL